MLLSLQECLEKCGESLQEIINYHMVSWPPLQIIPICSIYSRLRQSSTMISSHLEKLTLTGI